MVGGAKANDSGAKGEVKAAPDVIWKYVFPESQDLDFHSGKILTGGEFHLWLSKQGFSFQNVTKFDGQHHVCRHCGWKAKKNLVTGIRSHLPHCKKSPNSTSPGIFFNGKAINKTIRQPDHVWLDEDGRRAIAFENKNLDVSGSVEEKGAATPYFHDYYGDLLAEIGWSLEWHVFTVSGDRYAKESAISSLEDIVAFVFKLNRRIRFYNFTTEKLYAPEATPEDQDAEDQDGNKDPRQATELRQHLNGIHLMDSLEGMKQLPDASVDLVITSPPYADMKVYEGGFNGFHPDEYVRWFLPYVSEIARILKPTGSFILNINDKVVDTFRHPFLFELIYAIHNPEKYARAEMTDPVPMHGLRLYERLFWNKGKYLANPRRFGDKLEYLFWFSKTRARKLNMDAMRMVYDEKSVKRMERPLIKRFVRESGEEVTEYKDGGSGSWQPNPLGALPSTLIEEGAMKHVHPIVETFDEGTAVVLDDLGDGVLHAVWPKVGEAAAPSTLVTIGSETRRILGSHVAVYPERLVSYFVQGATDEGDVVLDPFSGTGTTAVVAKALGRQYIGFDISEEYVNFGRERLERGPYLEELKQKTPRKGGLFDYGRDSPNNNG